jgi:hypothetical protein
MENSPPGIQTMPGGAFAGAGFVFGIVGSKTGFSVSRLETLEGVSSEAPQSRATVGAVYGIPRRRKSRVGNSTSRSWRRFAAQSLLGEALLCKKEFARAEPLLMAGYNGLKSKMSHMPAYEQMQVKRAAERIAQLHSAWNKPEQEAKWRATVAQL